MNENNPRPASPDSDIPPLETTAERELRRRTRRSFLVGLFAAGAGYASWRWVGSRPEMDSIPGPLRKNLRFNERISEAVFNPGRRVKELSEASLTLGGPRANGEIGLEQPIDLETWRLLVTGTDLQLTLSDIKSLPEQTQITPLNCIEGWTTVARWTGVRLSDFTEKFFPPGRTRQFVGLSTPAKDYYVGLDAPSAFHEQTLLCYAINGQPLSNEHGAPLRLLIPTKYGIKNLKRVGEITFSQNRPPDYWAEQGYDWYAGF